MPHGTVKWFSDKKHFGFIGPDEGDDVFVHATSLPPGMELFEGQRVSFEVEQAERGPRAVNVTALDEPPRQIERPAPRRFGGRGGGRRDFKPKRFHKNMF